MPKAEKQPWMKFYPSDWRGDPKLRACSLAARGLWIECIGVMHEAVPYGHLLLNGQPVTDVQLAAMAGTDASTAATLIVELETTGVLSRTRDGTIYSRRMTRDAKKAAIARKNGKSGGNPSLSKDEGKSPPDNPKDKGTVKPHIPDARDNTNTRTCLDAAREDEIGAAKQLGVLARPPSDFRLRGQRTPGDVLSRFMRQSGPPEKRLKNQDRANADMVRHLTTLGGMDTARAWETVMAARDEDSPHHTEAARLCEKASRQHKLGFFVEESA